MSGSSDVTGKFVWSRDPDDSNQVRPYRGVVDDPIDVLELPASVVRALTVCGVEIVEDVTGWTVADLANVRDLSPSDVTTLGVALERVGVPVGEESSKGQTFSYRPGEREGHGIGEPGANVWALALAREFHDDVMFWPFRDVSVPYLIARSTYIADDETCMQAVRGAVLAYTRAVSEHGRIIDTRAAARALCDAIGEFVHPDATVACRPI